MKLPFMQPVKATSPLIPLILSMQLRELLQVTVHSPTHCNLYYVHVCCMVLILVVICAMGRQCEEEQDLVQRGAEGGCFP